MQISKIVACLLAFSCCNLVNADYLEKLDEFVGQDVPQEDHYRRLASALNYLDNKQKLSWKLGFLSDKPSRKGPTQLRNLLLVIASKQQQVTTRFDCLGNLLEAQLELAHNFLGPNGLNRNGPMYKTLLYFFELSHEYCVEEYQSFFPAHNDKILNREIEEYLVELGENVSLCANADKSDQLWLYKCLFQVAQLEGFRVEKYAPILLNYIVKKEGEQFIRAQVKKNKKLFSKLSFENYINSVIGVACSNFMHSLHRKSSYDDKADLLRVMEAINLMENTLGFHLKQLEGEMMTKLLAYYAQCKPLLDRATITALSLEVGELANRL